MYYNIPNDMCVNPLALTERGIEKEREKKKGAIDFNDENIGRNVKFEYMNGKSFGNLRNFHWLGK